MSITEQKGIVPFPCTCEPYKTHEPSVANYSANLIVEQLKLTEKRLITEWLPWLHGLCWYQRLIV